MRGTLVPSRSSAVCGAIALLLAVSNSSCSFVLVSGPPGDAAARSEWSCTESVGPPVTDTVLAGVGGMMTLFLLALSGLSDTDTNPQGRVALFALPAVVLPAGSAVYGYVQTSRCRRAQRARVMNPPLPGPPLAMANAGQPPPSVAAWLAAVVVAPADARSAPFAVAPFVKRFAAGERLTVSSGVQDGWRQVALPGGFAYIRDDVVKVDVPQPR